MSYINVTDIGPLSNYFLNLQGVTENGILDKVTLNIVQSLEFWTLLMPLEHFRLTNTN